MSDVPQKEGPWKMRPLRGKYYGTYIDGPNEGAVQVWGARTKLRPSARELVRSEQTTEEFMASGGTYDSHYEDEGDYEAAMAIVNALNWLEAREKGKP